MNMCRNVLVILVLSMISATQQVSCSAVNGRDHVVVSSKGVVTQSDGVGVTKDTVWLVEVFREILEVDLSRDNGTQIEESRKHRTKPQPSFMEKILPMMVTPFLISSSMIPMMLISIFVMLVKSAFIGKVGVILLLLNMLRNRSNSGGFFTHNVDFNSRHGEMDLAMEHYGYHGDEEYGAYVNRRRRRK